MKSSFRLFIGTTTLCLTVLLSGCGQTGPLYLPKPPAAKSAKSGDAKVTPSAGTPAPGMSASPGTPVGAAKPVTGAPVTPAPMTPSEFPSTVPASQQ